MTDAQGISVSMFGMTLTALPMQVDATCNAFLLLISPSATQLSQKTSAENRGDKKPYGKSMPFDTVSLKCASTKSTHSSSKTCFLTVFHRYPSHPNRLAGR